MFLLHVCSRCLLHTLAWHLCSHASPVFANAHVPPFEHVMRKTECTKSHGSVGSDALGVLEACSWKALSGENTPPYLIVSKKAVECWLESDYNGGPRPWLQEGDLGGVSCVLGDKRRLVCVCVCGEHWGLQCSGPGSRGPGGCLQTVGTLVVALGRFIL